MICQCLLVHPKRAQHLQSSLANWVCMCFGVCKCVLLYTRRLPKTEKPKYAFQMKLNVFHCTSSHIYTLRKYLSRLHSEIEQVRFLTILMYTKVFRWWKFAPLLHTHPHHYLLPNKTFKLGILLYVYREKSRFPECFFLFCSCVAFIIYIYNTTGNENERVKAEQTVISMWMVIPDIPSHLFDIA